MRSSFAQWAWNMGYTDGRENEPRKRVENHGEVPGSEHLQTMHQQEPRQTKASRTSLQHSTHALPAHRQRAPQLCARHVVHTRPASLTSRLG